MKGAYCKKCDVNWASLPTQDTEINDETYEYCPKCYTALDLEPVQPGDTFYCNVSGVIINVRTGEPKVQPVITSYYKEQKPFNMAEWQRKQELKQTFEDNALEAYAKASHMGEKAGWEAYNQVMQGFDAEWSRVNQNQSLKTA